jgi:hypothetical protein
MGTRLVAALFLGALLFSPGVVAAEEEGPSLEQFVIETAQTKEEHEALAKYYDEEAATARSIAKRHERMAGSYLRWRGSTKRNKPNYISHCKGIAAKQNEIAQEFEELAKMHRDDAKQTQ